MHTYTLSSGDATNGLLDPTSFRVDPLIVTESDGFRDTVISGNTVPIPTDPRLAAIIEPTTFLAGSGVSSALEYTLYPDPTSPVPIITNKELIMDAAEVKMGLGDLAGAMNIVNEIRADAGLSARPATSDQATVISFAR